MFHVSSSCCCRFIFTSSLSHGKREKDETLCFMLTGALCVIANGKWKRIRWYLSRGSRLSKCLIKAQKIWINFPHQFVVSTWAIFIFRIWRKQKLTSLQRLLMFTTEYFRFFMSIWRGFRIILSFLDWHKRIHSLPLSTTKKQVPNGIRLFSFVLVMNTFKTLREIFLESFSEIQNEGDKVRKAWENSIIFSSTFFFYVLSASL